MLRRLAMSVVLAGFAGVSFAYLNEFMKDEPGWRFRREPSFRVDFWITFVMVFAASYLILWWNREE